MQFFIMFQLPSTAVRCSQPLIIINTFHFQSNKFVCANNKALAAQNAVDREAKPWNSRSNWQTQSSEIESQDKQIHIKIKGK